MIITYFPFKIACFLNFARAIAERAGFFHLPLIKFAVNAGGMYTILAFVGCAKAYHNVY